MVMTTYRNFKCVDGHKGEETTQENDHPYSKNWESIKANGMKAVGKDERGYASYECSVCGKPMTLIEKNIP